MGFLSVYLPLNFIQSTVDKFNETIINEERYKYIIQGLGNTLLITVFAVLIGIVLGTIVALIKVSPNKKYKKFNFFKTLLNKILKAIATIYLTIIRGTPVVVQLLIMYYIVYTSGDKIVVAILAFGINSGAYVAEVIRSGIQSVDKGQIEAGRSLGLTQRTTMIKIVFPQALKNVAPAVFNEFIALLKETSVAGYIGVFDLTKGGDIIRSQTYDAFTSLITVAAVYLVIVMILTTCLSILERRLHRSDNR